MPYAKGDIQSRSPLEGGIEISEAQYQKALKDRQAGKTPRVVDGVLKTFDSSSLSVYSIVDGSSKQVSSWEGIPEGYTEVKYPGPFHKWDGSSWVEDEQAALEHWRSFVAVSSFQAKAALARSGYLSKVKTILSGLGEDHETVIAWDNATTFKRTSPHLQSIADSLPLTAEEMDSLFKLAETIEG